MATARRPYGFFGKPLLASGVTSVHVLPPSAERKSPLPDGLSGPSPPERNVQPFRRKSQVQAKRTFGSFGSMARPETPVERFEPFRIWVQFAPPSVVLYRPRSGESLQSAPGTAA